jgi:hypothetical protein
MLIRAAGGARRAANNTARNQRPLTQPRPGKQHHSTRRRFRATILPLTELRGTVAPDVGPTCSLTPPHFKTPCPTFRPTSERAETSRSTTRRSEANAGRSLADLEDELPLPTAGTAVALRQALADFLAKEEGYRQLTPSAEVLVGTWTEIRQDGSVAVVRVSTGGDGDLCAVCSGWKTHKNCTVKLADDDTLVVQLPHCCYMGVLLSKSDSDSSSNLRVCWMRSFHNKTPSGSVTVWDRETAPTNTLKLLAQGAASSPQSEPKTSGLTAVRQWARANLDDTAWAEFATSRDQLQASRDAHGLERVDSIRVPNFRSAPMRKKAATQMIADFRGMVSELKKQTEQEAEGRARAEQFVRESDSVDAVVDAERASVEAQIALLKQ